MSLSGWILKKAGWTFKVNMELPKKCVIIIAPHTSNWDFVLGELAIHSVGIKAGFLMKDSWFFFPIGNILKALGGIPVNRRQHTNLTKSIVKAFNDADTLAIGITPEGARGPCERWHKGALFIAKEAKVPLVLAYFDYGKREACIDREFVQSNDPEADMVRIKQYYQGITAKYPKNFVTGLK